MIKRKIFIGIIASLFFTAFIGAALVAIFESIDRLSPEPSNSPPNIAETIVPGTPANNKIIIKTYPNKSIRSYHIRFDVTDATMKEIFNIRGVIVGKSKYSSSTYSTYYRKEEYSVTVKKGRAFDWDEIEPVVIKILVRNSSKN